MPGRSEASSVHGEEDTDRAYGSETRANMATRDFKRGDMMDGFIGKGFCYRALERALARTFIPRKVSPE